jgi:hypothetical protein
MAKKPRKPAKRRVPPGKKLIFRSCFTTKNGQRIHAARFGLRAFAFLVNDED